MTIETRHKPKPKTAEANRSALGFEATPWIAAVGVRPHPARFREKLPSFFIEKKRKPHRDFANDPERCSLAGQFATERDCPAIFWLRGLGNVMLIAYGPEKPVSED